MQNGKPAAVGAAAGFLLVYGPMIRAWARALADPELRDWLGVPSVTQVTKTIRAKGWHWRWSTQ